MFIQSLIYFLQGQEGTNRPCQLPEEILEGCVNLALIQLSLK